MAKRQEIPDILGPARQQVSVLDDVLTGGKPTRVAVASIRHDGATQMRAGLSQDTVEDYTQAMIDAGGFGTFPPMVVFHDGADYWLGDGFHRLAAFKQAFPGYESLHILCDVRVGTRRDAVLFAAAANATHGLRRTNADKRRAVETLLRDEEWAHWSDGEIARRCAVSQPFVSNVRRDLASTQNGFESTERTGTDGRTINTANIGSRPAPKVVYTATTPAPTVVPSEATHSRQQGAELAICRICHRPLSDPASAANGIGPCCAGKVVTAAASGADPDDDDDEDEQPLQVADVDDILTPDRHEVSSATQKRNERINSVLRRLYAARGAAHEFEELTGVYTHTPAFERVMDAMIGSLEANLV